MVDTFFHEHFNFKEVEEVISYEFRNKNLLRQAFTRKTFKKEADIACEDNEVLEFIGDSILRYSLIVLLNDAFGDIGITGEYIMNEYSTPHSITNFFQRFEKKETLSNRIKELDLQKYLLVNETDSRNKKGQLKFRGDLFEAIVGAVAIDCGFDQNVFVPFVADLLNIQYLLESDKSKVKVIDYVTEIFKWCQKYNSSCPKYLTTLKSEGYEVIVSFLIDEALHEFKYVHEDREVAKRMAAKEAYEFLEERKLILSFKKHFNEEVEEDRAIDYLSQLWNKGYISEPLYLEPEKNELKESTIWTQKLILIKENIMQEGFGESPKIAKKRAAKLVLDNLLCELHKK